MSDKQVLLDAAALLVKLASTTNPSTPPTAGDLRLAEIIRVWEMMVEEFKQRELPHEWVDLKPGTPYWETGDNRKESPFYQKFINFWRAMERENVIDHTGKPFNQIQRTKEGGNKMFEDAIKFLARTPQGIAWFQHPLNANYLPKAQDMPLLYS